MERNRMEEEFRERLNQREITPSAHAWDRLDAMLNEKENVKVVPVRSNKWLYIAASFLGFILIGTMFFRDEKTNTGNQVAVEDVKENPAHNDTDLTAIDSVINVEPKPVSNENRQSRQVAVSEPGSKSNRNIIPGKTAPNVNQNQNQNEMQVAQVQNQQPATNSQQPKIINQINNPVNATADEQLASIDPKLQNPKTIKVDASSLLSQVDGELELSFREKVIKLANKKYQNVKVALANRNQE